MYRTIAEIAVARYRESTALCRRTRPPRETQPRLQAVGTRRRRGLPRLPAPHVYRLDLEPLPGAKRGQLLCYARAGEDLVEVARRWYGSADLAPDLALLNGIHGTRLERSQVLRLPLLPERSTPVEPLMSVA